MSFKCITLHPVLCLSTRCFPLGTSLFPPCFTRYVSNALGKKRMVRISLNLRKYLMKINWNRELTRQWLLWWLSNHAWVAFCYQDLLVCCSPDTRRRCAPKRRQWGHSGLPSCKDTSPLCPDRYTSISPHGRPLPVYHTQWHSPPTSLGHQRLGNPFPSSYVLLVACAYMKEWNGKK